MAEINHVALICPREYDMQISANAWLRDGNAAMVAHTLRQDSLFTDALLLTPPGEGERLATATFLAGELATSGACTIIGSPAIGDLQTNPTAWKADIKGYLTAAITGEPPFDPPIDHNGSVVVLAHPAAIGEIFNLSSAGISPSTAYFPRLVSRS